MTTQKEFALRYTRLFETAQDGILLLNHPHSEIEDANPYILKMLGYRLEEIVGKKVWELGLIGDQALAAIASETLLREGYVRYEHLDLQSRDGRRVPVEFVCNSYDVAGTTVIQCNIRDISDRLKLAEELEAGRSRELAQATASIAALSNVIESRDPYTAGHQARVADLAVAIARLLDLSEHDIDGLRLACLVHDIGKIGIPVEILTKPGKLSSIEINMLQGHVQAGVNILKPLNLAWPVSDFVAQHHERLNGEGYPNGLKGEQISLQARIMAVADTVESMVSNRPYRPGLGIDVALQEISSRAGDFYDASAVDACVMLFRERDYQLPEPPKTLGYIGLGKRQGA